MTFSAIALEPQDGDDKPVLIGQLPKAGTFGFAIQFGKYQETEADRKICRKAFDFCDGDISRPMYVVGEMKAKDIRDTLNKLGKRIRVAHIINGPERVYVKASSQMEFRFYQAWMNQVMSEIVANQ